MNGVLGICHMNMVLQSMLLGLPMPRIGRYEDDLSCLDAERYRRDGVS
jgi:hypothetical protein